MATSFTQLTASFSHDLPSESSPIPIELNPYVHKWFTPMESFAKSTAPPVIHEAISFVQSLQNRLLRLTSQIEAYNHTLKQLHESDTKRPYTHMHPDARHMLEKLIALASEHMTSVMIEEQAFCDTVQEGCEDAEMSLEECLDSARASLQDLIREYDAQLYGLLKGLSLEVFLQTEVELSQGE